MTSDTFKLRYAVAGHHARASARRNRTRDWTWPSLMVSLVLAGVLLALGLGRLAGVAEAPARLLGEAIPPSIQDVQYSSTEWFGLVAQPSHYLSFKADINDVAQMLGRGGFESQPPSHGWSGPAWWRPSRPWLTLQHFRRSSADCAVERVWWDPQTGEVLYLRFCP